MRDKPPTGLCHEIGLQGTREHKYFRLFLDAGMDAIVCIIVQFYAASYSTDVSSESENDVLYSFDSLRLKDNAQTSFGKLLPPLQSH